MVECICNLKQNEEKKIGTSSYTTISIALDIDGYYIKADGDDTVWLNINYCPICGKKLYK